MQNQPFDPSSSRGPSSSYVSKLDEFASFLNRAKYPALTLTHPAAAAPPAAPPPAARHAPTLLASSSSQGGGAAAGSSSQGVAAGGTGGGAGGRATAAAAASGVRNKLLLIDDLPHVGDADRRAQLGAMLARLAAASKCPVVLISTLAKGSGAGQDVPRGAVSSDSGLHKVRSSGSACVCGICICFDASAGPEPSSRAYQMSHGTHRKASKSNVWRWRRWWWAVRRGATEGASLPGPGVARRPAARAADAGRAIVRVGDDERRRRSQVDWWRRGRAGGESAVLPAGCARVCAGHPGGVG